MAHYHWRELFSPHIWQRGLEYYHEDRILDIQYRGSKITAEIEGTEIYTVFVTLDAKTNKIEDYFCECPYGEDGTPCKHLAALLCALEDGDQELMADDTEKSTIEQVVNLLPEQQMRELLIQFAQNDSYIRERIQIAATKKLPNTQKDQWKQDLDALTESAADRHGFIDYEEAYDYCFSLQEYLDDRIPDFLSAGLNKEAFELTCLVFQTGMAQDMDDSDGGLTILAGSCMDAWSSIMELSDLNFQREMYRWFITHYTDYDLSEMFLEDYVFDVPWNVEIVPEILRFLDQRIQMCVENCESEYRLNDLIVHRIQWMEKSGAGKPEIERYMVKYHHLSAVRNLQISQAIHDGDYGAALTLLEESKKLDAEKIGLVAKYSARKIEIYEKVRDISALRDELAYYIFTFRQDDLVYVEKTKALLSPVEWEDMRARLLNSASMYSQVYPLLERERMYEQLMERIEVHSDIYALERYESALKKGFAKRCMNVYVTHLHQAMRRASNRKAYWSVIQTLKKLRKYPDGKAVAQELADSWKQEYPRRSSMLDELRKAGF